MLTIKEMYLQAFPSKQSNPPDNKAKKLSKKSRNKSVHAMSSEAENNQVHLAATYAAKLQKEFYTMVFLKWRELAKAMRENTFENSEDVEIDIYDMKAKEWGYLLRELFGDRLGTGDYGHMTIEHTAMLFRRFLSFKNYSNQGFEALHRLQRQVYTRATNHDAKSPGQSLEDILVHHYTEKLLFFRLCVNEALDCYDKGKQLKFRGCGWTLANAPKINDEDVNWLSAMKILMEKMLGSDFFEYYFDKNSGVKIVEEMVPRFAYDHSKWEDNYETLILEVISNREIESQKGPVKKKTRKSLFNCSITKDDSLPSANENKSGEHMTTHAQNHQDHMNKNKNKIEISSPHSTSQSKKSKIDIQTSNKAKCILQCPVNSASSTYDLRIFKSGSKATRCQLANLILPALKHIEDDEIAVITNPHQLVLLDPFNTTHRPSRLSIEHSERLLAKLRNNGRQTHVYGITFGNIGTFAVDSLSILNRFCTISEIRRDVISEIQWLNIDDGLSAKENQDLSSALLDNEPSTVITKVCIGSNTRAVDTTSFACLVGERYVDNMIIDVCLNKYMWDLKAQKASNTLVFPTSVWTWESGNDQAHLKTQIQTCVNHCRTSTTYNLQIIIPVYMDVHWGIVFVDFCHGQIYFDDGLNQNVPRGLLKSLQHILDIIHEVIPGTTLVWWNSLTTFQRLGMPRQNAMDAVQNNQGSGSCGIGIILVGKDLMANGNNALGNFAWSFGRSRFLRKKLMLQILKWA